MEAQSIIFVSGLALYFIMSGIITRLNGRIINDQKQLIKQYAEIVKQMEEKNDELTKYCIAQIMKQAVENQEFETANRCLKILNDLGIHFEKKKDI